METDAVHSRTEEHYTNFVECFTLFQSAKPTFESSIGKLMMAHTQILGYLSIGKMDGTHTHVKISQHWQNG